MELVVVALVLLSVGACLLARRVRPAGDGDAGRLAEILAVAERLNSTRHLPELAELVTRSAAETFGCRRAILYLWSPQAGAFTMRSAFDRTSEEFRIARDHITGEHLATLIESAGGSDDPALRPGEAAVVAADSELWIPLVSVRDGAIGLLVLAEEAGADRVPSVRRRLLPHFTQQAVTALESAEIYDRLAKRNEELSAASRQLDSLADLKSNLVANVGHELRTPLTSIAAYTELIQRNLKTLDADSLDDFLKIIGAESAKLSGVINDILDVGRLEDDVTARFAEGVDLVELVSELAEPWKARAAQEEVDFEIDSPSAPLVLDGDRVMLGQLLTHLVGNAFKFTPSGGRIALSVGQSGTALRIRIDDTGIGIPPDRLGEIFETFVQADGTATRAHNGQGLGLAICRDIVFRHDGRIWAENRTDGGASFNVLLPQRSAVVKSGSPIEPAGPAFAPGEFLDRLLAWVAGSLGVEVVSLMVPDEGGENLVIQGALGLPPSVVQSARIRRGGGLAGRVWEQDQPLLLNDISLAESHGRRENEPRYTTPSVLCVPLGSGDGFRGVVTVNNRTDGRPLDHDDFLFLDAMAPRLAHLIDRHLEWCDASGHAQQIRDSLRLTTPVGNETTESRRTVCREICLAAARRLGLDDAELGRLAFAIRFYDVGLENIPRGVLLQQDELSGYQRLVVESHVAEAVKILAPLGPEPAVNRMVLHHHENFDGSGYPDGLSGEAIPVGARLIRLTDTLESLLQDRPGRAALSPAVALEEIRRDKGRLYCPRLTTVFLDEAAARLFRLDTPGAVADVTDDTATRGRVDTVLVS